MPTTRPLITVLGATGAQGGGLARALLADPQRRHAVRAVTRQATSPKAQALAAAGAEICCADLDDPAALRRAFDGAHGVFALTNFWEHFSPDRELLQARNIADAARACDVAHVLWSTLEDTRRWVPLEDDQLPTLMGQYKVPPFDAKGAADSCFRQRGVPTTLLYASVHWDNLIRFHQAPTRDSHGGLVFTLPMGDRPLPGIAAADIGVCAAALFAMGEAAIGRSFGVAGEHLTGAQMAQALSRALGEPVRHVSPGFADYAQRRFAGAAELANMYQFKHDFNADYCARRPVAGTRLLHPGVLGFEAWLAANVARLPIVAGAPAG